MCLKPMYNQNNVNIITSMSNPTYCSSASSVTYPLQHLASEPGMKLNLHSFSLPLLSF